VEALVQRFVDVRDAIEMGAINPVHVADAIKAFTPSTQLARVYRYHQEIQDARGLAAAAPTY
jgi:hypothetical protein